MFEHSAAFNNGGVTLEFDTTRVRDMSRMFRYAVAFQQEAMLSDMGRVTHVQHMLVHIGPLARIITARVNRLAVGFEEVSGRVRVHAPISFENHDVEHRDGTCTVPAVLMGVAVATTTSGALQSQ